MLPDSLKDQAKAVLVKIGKCLRGGEDSSRMAVLRCSTLEEFQTAAAMLPRVFPRINWVTVNVSQYGVETAVKKAAQLSRAGTHIPLLHLFPGEDSDGDMTEACADHLELLNEELNLCSLPMVVSLLAPSIRVVVKDAPGCWEGKGEYVAWPSAPPDFDKEEEGSEAPMFNPDDEPPPPEETRKVLDEMHGESAADYLVNVSELHLRQGNVEAARLFLLRAVQIYSQSANLGGMAKGYHLLGMAAQGRGDYDEAVEWFDQSIDNRRILNDGKGLSDSYAAKGYAHYLKGEYDSAVRAFDDAMKLDQELGLTSRVSAGYRKMAMVFELKQDLRAAEQLYLKSLQMEEEEGTAAGKARVYHHLGRMKEEQKDHDQAIEYYNQSLALKEEAGDAGGVASSHHQLGNLCLGRGEFEDAISHYEQAMSLEKETGDKQGLARTGAQLGLAYRETGQVEKALKQLLKAYQLLQRLRSPLAAEVLGKVEEIQDLVSADTFDKLLREAAITTTGP